MKKRIAVLVIDVQKALCIGNGATFKSADVITNINKVISKAREADAPIIFVQHETKEGAFVRDSDGWQLAQELNRSSSDIFIVKFCSDAFKDTNLKKQLDEQEIEHLVVCGMQSEFCVDSTVRRALSLNYSVTVVADGHTTENNEVLPAPTISKHHNITWENITSYGVRAKVINADKINF